MALYNRTNEINERALRSIHEDSNSLSVHQKNLQRFLTEIYKTINNLNPSFKADLFLPKDVPCHKILVKVIILFYLKLGRICKVLILSGLLDSNHGRLCQEK